MSNPATRTCAPTLPSAPPLGAMPGSGRHSSGHAKVYGLVGRSVSRAVCARGSFDLLRRYHMHLYARADRSSPEADNDRFRHRFNRTVEAGWVARAVISVATSCRRVSRANSAACLEGKDPVPVRLHIHHCPPFGSGFIKRFVQFPNMGLPVIAHSRAASVWCRMAINRAPSPAADPFEHLLVTVGIAKRQYRPSPR